MRRLSRKVKFLGEHGVDRLERADLAAFELAHDGVDDLQRSGHAQADEGGLDAVHDGRIELGPGAHQALPFTASTLPSAS